MAKTLYVGNLAYTTSESDVRELFEQYGTVRSFRWMTDQYTGRPRGFCFVEMDDEEANAAMHALDGRDLDGRAIKVNEARPRRDRQHGRRG